jgi:DNA segregation ATPase FtsK/SpoIIIE-like protein
MIKWKNGRQRRNLVCAGSWQAERRWKNQPAEQNQQKTIRPGARNWARTENGQAAALLLTRTAKTEGINPKTNSIRASSRTQEINSKRRDIPKQRREPNEFPFFERDKTLNNHTKSQLQDKTTGAGREQHRTSSRSSKTTAASPKKIGVLADQLQQYEKLSTAEIWWPRASLVNKILGGITGWVLLSWAENRDREPGPDQWRQIKEQNENREPLAFNSRADPNKKNRQPTPAQESRGADPVPYLLPVREQAPDEDLFENEWKIDGESDWAHFLLAA